MIPAIAQLDIVLSSYFLSEEFREVFGVRSKVTFAVVFEGTLKVSSKVVFEDCSVV